VPIEQRDERLLDRMELTVLREALDGGHRAPVGLHREHRAREHGLAVHQHRARAADPVLAAHAHAVELYVLAQEVGQQLPRRRGAIEREAIHGQADGQR
jgi:hypothetical protein